jgi:hypothetical protein
MTIATVVKYLLGSRQAILEVGNSRSAVWVGLVLVLSAGFAREYDGEDLLHEPWHLLLPLGASLVTSFLLFCLIWLVSRGSAPEQTSFLSRYRAFLGLYWTTAPLAWLYALPAERLFSATDAVAVNLWLLGIVSAWRVMLMTRVVAVLYGVRTIWALPVVLLFADTVAVALVFLAPVPIITMMGGVRLTESEQLIQSTAVLVGLWGILTWLVWLTGTLLATTRVWSWRPDVGDSTSGSTISRPLWALAVLSLVVWLPILPLTQPEQQLRRQVERDLRAGRTRQAVETMSAHAPDDFPPHWDPPPRLAYGQANPPPLEVLEAAGVYGSDWVRQLYLEKVQQQIGTDYRSYFFWNMISNEELDRYLAFLEQLPRHSHFLAEHREDLAQQLKRDRTESQKERIRKLIGQDQPEASHHPADPVTP